MLIKVENDDGDENHGFSDGVDDSVCRRRVAILSGGTSFSKTVT